MIQEVIVLLMVEANSKDIELHLDTFYQTMAFHYESNKIESEVNKGTTFTISLPLVS